ncbi:hypothetical protein Q604_UNBC17948G0002, partial [human gut metagenome]
MLKVDNQIELTDISKTANMIYENNSDI